MSLLCRCGAKDGFLAPNLIDWFSLGAYRLIAVCLGLAPFAAGAAAAAAECKQTHWALPVAIPHPV